MLFLMVDDRERAVTPFLAAFKSQVLVRRLSRGDYAIVNARSSDQIDLLAVVERKTLKDYGDSIRDGRMQNKFGLIEVREHAPACQVYYVIEGPAYPKPDTEYGGIAFNRIEASMFHLMTQFAVQIIRSADQADTARLLIRLLESMAARPPQSVAEAPRNVGDRELIAGSDESTILFVAQAKTDIDVRRDIWSSVRGIGETTAAKLAQMTVVEVLRQLAMTGSIVGVRLTTAQLLNLMELQEEVWNTTQLAFLLAIPGIGKKKQSELSRKSLCLRMLWKNRSDLGDGDRKLLEAAFE